MDAIDLAVGGILAQIVDGSLGEAGARLWESLSRLVHKALGAREVQSPAVFDGDLGEDDVLKVVDLLAHLSSENPGIRQGILEWIDEARCVEAGEVVKNTVRGNVSGKVVQARDIGSIQM